MENSLQALNASQALEEWSFKIKECRNSGLTVLDWCKSQGIKPQRFYYWQKKIFTLLSPQQTAEFAELPLPVTSESKCSNDIKSLRRRFATKSRAVRGGPENC